MMPERAEVIRHIAAIVCRNDLGHPTRVAIDGVTASGKSTLACEIIDAVAARGRPVVHLTMDGYHHPREHRYRQGRLSARGYYDDAYDFTAVRGGSRETPGCPAAGARPSTSTTPGITRRHGSTSNRSAQLNTQP
jgi:hypothetical protein